MAGFRDGTVLVFSVVDGRAVEVKVEVKDGPGDNDDGNDGELGGSSCHSMQYSLPPTSAEQSTPGLYAMNLDSVIPHALAIDLHVSPLSAAHENEHSRRWSDFASTVMVLRRVRAPKK